MSVQPLTEVVSAIRVLVSDTGDRTSLIRDEGPRGAIDATNKRFTVSRFPVLNLPLFELRLNSALLVQGGGAGQYQIDTDKGIIAMGTAPAKATPDELLATYNWLWYSDADYHEFIFNGAQRIAGIQPEGGTVIARATDAITKTDDGLMAALRLYAACEMNYKRAQENAEKFNASAGGQNTSVANLSSAYVKLAESFCKSAEAARDDFYKRFGARNAPAFAIKGFTGIQRYQPRR